jgi:hypothetical protein
MSGAQKTDKEITMQNPMQTKTQAPNGCQSNAKTMSEMFELTDADLQSVSGGLNPQPLPPRQRSI